MWSFEGEHRRRPNVSLSGASRLMDKNTFLEKLKKEREARENNKRREVAAVQLQSYIRGCLCRIRTNQYLRQSCDDLLATAPVPLTQSVARTLCLRMLWMFRRKYDGQRLSLLCATLVRCSPYLHQWLLQEPAVWTNILTRLLILALKSVSTADLTGPTSSSGSGPSHAGPLRLLEVLTQPQGWEGISSDQPLTPQCQADLVFGLLIPLIKEGYFHHLIKLLILKVPPVDERTIKSSSALASSILSLIQYPLYLVAMCRRHSEPWDAAALPVYDMPWAKALYQQCNKIRTQLSVSDKESSRKELVLSYSESQPQSSEVVTLMKNALPLSVEAGAVIASDDAAKTLGPKRLVSDITENTSVPLFTAESIKDGRINALDNSKPSKCPREELEDQNNREKVLRISGPQNEFSDSNISNSLVGSQHHVVTDVLNLIPETEVCTTTPATLLQTTVSSVRSKLSTDYGGQLLCYAFGGVAVAVTANIMNLTLYNLVEELLSASSAPQVHHYLVPSLTAESFLLCRPATTHALIQAVHLVLAPREKQAETGGDAGFGKGFGVDAPTKLATLLMMIPIKTALPTTSLQLYLQSCRCLVRHSVHFLPVRKHRYTGVDAALPDEDDHDDDDEEFDDEDEDEDMDVDEFGNGKCAASSSKVLQKPSENIIELGEWCLSHINSPEYVSWVLDEVERTNLDREVITEFCGLTHTLLTAPCLTLFQCRLLYGVVGRQRMQRAMWSLLSGLYPCWHSGPDRTGRSTVRLLDTVSRGTPLAPADRNTLVPVLASFATALLAVLATLHDSELVTSPPDSLEGLLHSTLQQHDALSKAASATTTGSGAVTSRNASPVGSNFAFSVPELVTISGTLRDVCVGLAELAHPDTRASTLTDVAYKPTWDHCFRCCVDVVRQLHLRDTRRCFCPPQHWLTSRISLPSDATTRQTTASYRSLLSSRGAARRQAFMPATWRTRAQLLAEGGTGDGSEGSGGVTTHLPVYEKVRATVLQELPFVFSFPERAEVFLRLVHEDRSIAQENSAFNVGPSISVRLRRTHLYEDSFEKLSPENEPNMRLSLRVQLLNAAGAVEAGVDGGGLFREFLSELLKSAFDPNRGFFLMTRENTLYPNPSAHLLHEDIQSHYYFIGRMLGKALYEKLLVEIPLAGFFLSKLLTRKGFSIEFHHLDSLDPELCRNLLYLKTYRGDVQELGLDFTVLTSELGHNTVIELVPDGANIPVTSDNKIEYIYRMADFKLNKQIAKQCYAFRKGLHDVVPAEWLQLFDWRELQTMISGAATPIDISDLRDNTTYRGDYNDKNKTIQLFWQVVEQFDEHQRRQLLKFVTSCSRPPLLGFKDLYPPFCIQPSGSEQRLPSAATCVNILKLPEYSDPITLREKLLYAINANAGFELS